jgi:CRP/FNR family nitrogen fixation transcriptional regulator
MLVDTGFHHDVTFNSQAIVAHLLDAGQPSATTFHPEGAIIYADGDRAGRLYVVEFGVVRICRLTSDGRRQIHAFHFAGEVFGFETGTEHQFYAESVNGAGVRSLRTSGSEALTSNLLALALNGLVKAQQHQLVLGRRSATEKVAGFILDMIERLGGDDIVGLPMQRNDIADYLGLTFETVSRALRVLREEGAVRVPTVHQIEILDLDKLHELAG